ncbi:MAG TPA: hypothetical protein VJW55_20970 [Candidatus Angelobacter sp.]|nr:hypothetical protein [Candidatus Angelobacter sp.]
MRDVKNACSAVARESEHNSIIKVKIERIFFDKHENDINKKYFRSQPLFWLSYEQLPIMTLAFQKSRPAAIYLHFPCFDGIVSGALAILFLGKLRGWRFDAIHAVNYDLQSNWLNTSLPQRSCIVDFLYHPEAEFWCDHHTTTFLSSNLRAEFAAQPDPMRIYDQESPSTARLLWNRAAETLKQENRLEEMVNWTDKIDAANYDDVNQALFGTHPALIISRSLAVDADSVYCGFLVRSLCDLPLRDLAAHPEVKRRAARAEELNREGLSRVKEEIHLEDNIAIFDVLTEDASVNRYAAFYYHPDVQYSIGTFRGKDSTTVRVNANPWLRFLSPNLGEMIRAAAKNAGLPSAGGGHARVGSLRLDNKSHSAADKVVAYLIEQLHGDLKDKERSQWPRVVTR